MPSEIALDDHASEGATEHDRLDDAQHVTETHHIVSPGVQRPLVWRSPVAPSSATVVVDHNLSDVGQLVETAASEQRRIHRRTAMKHQ